MENWPTFSYLHIFCGSLWLLWPGHSVFLVLTCRTWIALAHFPSEGTHSLFGHMVPLWGSFSLHLFPNPRAKFIISGELDASTVSGCPLGPYLEPLVMADCSPRPILKRQMYSPPRKIPHPATYFAHNVLGLNCGIWHKPWGKLCLSFQSKSQYIKIGPSLLLFSSGCSQPGKAISFPWSSVLMPICPCGLLEMLHQSSKMDQRLFLFYWGGARDWGWWPKMVVFQLFYLENIFVYYLYN